ncbi:nitrite reductase small subunit NirD [Crenothrix sp.]|uniref:nitrite reductase small subunit NirD n=1 Tax=Crenothrix sp. TaxID=3100433 RepID=UPI00374DCCA7
MMAWKDVCSSDDLQPDSGVCVLVAGQQVALFYMPKEAVVYAIGNYDPIGKANVLSRGIIGDVKGEPVVASPLYKQHFSLISGVCVEDEQIAVPVYPVRIQNGRVEIQVALSVNGEMKASIDEEASA